MTHKEMMIARNKSLQVSIGFLKTARRDLANKKAELRQYEKAVKHYERTIARARKALRSKK